MIINILFMKDFYLNGVRCCNVTRLFSSFGRLSRCGCELCQPTFRHGERNGKKNNSRTDSNFNSNSKSIGQTPKSNVVEVWFSFSLPFFTINSSSNTASFNMRFRFLLFSYFFLLFYSHQTKATAVPLILSLYILVYKCVVYIVFVCFPFYFASFFLGFVLLLLLSIRIRRFFMLCIHNEVAFNFLLFIFNFMLYGTDVCLVHGTVCVCFSSLCSLSRKCFHNWQIEFRTNFNVNALCERECAYEYEIALLSPDRPFAPFANRNHSYKSLNVWCVCVGTCICLVYMHEH